MPRPTTPIEKIKAELGWVNEPVDPVDPNVCGCRHLLRCEQTAYPDGKCSRTPTEEIWSFRQYLCSGRRSYHFGVTSDRDR